MWSSLISSSLISIIASIYDFSAAILLPTLFLTLIFPRRYSTYVVREDIFLSCSVIFDETFIFSSLNTLVSSERRNFSGMRLISSSCYFTNFASLLSSFFYTLSNISNMDWIVMSRTALVPTVKVEVLMVVALLEIVMFSVGTYYVLVDGYIMRNIFFVGLVDFS